MNENRLTRSGGTATALSLDRGNTPIERGEVWAGKASTYYNMPLIKKAHWKWEIVVYFFLGGLAGGSYLVSSLAHLFGSEKDAPLIRYGRYISLVSILLSPIFLIKDLGRPARFLHMLRIIKFRSVMSLGSWGITIFGLFSGLTLAHQMAKDGFLRWFPALARVLRALPIKWMESIGSVVGLFVASYTGVLLSATAVPIWARARHILGPLFLASGLSTGLASLSLLLSLRHPNRDTQDTLERVERAEAVAMTTELGLIAALFPVLGPLAKPLLRGRMRWLFGAGAIGSGLLLPLLARLGWRLRGKAPSRGMTIGISLLTLLGGLLLRYVWIAVGRTSADDPQATHYYNAKEWEKR